MPTEGVVDALKKMHSVLRPGGVMLDSRPEPSPVAVTLKTATASTQVGMLACTSGFTHAITRAADALSLVVNDGLFHGVVSVDYSMLIYIDSFEEWQQFMKKWSSYYLPLDEVVTGLIRDQLEAGDTQLVLDTSVSTTRYTCSA
ncbi:MAG: hypothetical protein FI703_07025 [SAR202 cluster bacterium]|nr:hypothetical protein [SAR202 cluster bacterium]